VNIEKYNLQNLKRVVQNPTAMRGVVSHFGTRLNTAYYTLKGSSGTLVMNEDWDNLLILDGCRFDMFVEQWEGPGQLESRRSRASESRGFIKENFVGRDLTDTIHATANPHAAEIPEGTFFLLYNALGDYWDADLETVRPEALATELLRLHDEYPNKRLIGHFMQPHFPFIGDRGREFDQAGISEAGGDESESVNVWRKLQYGLGNISVQETWAAYRENLDLVLEVVYDLLDSLGGRTVVTADHGNLVGDRQRPVPVRGFGHPHRVYVPELVNVPWQVVEGEERREWVAGSPIEQDELGNDVVEDRLRALGYK
jgi:hypothetical protein